MATNDKSTTVDELSPNWLELPREVTVSILQKLGAVDIVMIAQRVCTQWRSICKEEPSMWRIIDMQNFGDLDLTEVDLALAIMCSAVDRSCGGLIDLSIGWFGTDELLNYVTQRCTQIRRLRLERCFDSITDEGLCEAAERLPLLEDLEISYCYGTGKALKKFGECCPLLKSLEINLKGYSPSLIDDDEAMAIAKTMPELRHLQLFENCMTNMGLEAILDGCPNLESLHLRECFHVDLKSSSSLRKRCAERIKDFCFDDDDVNYGYDSDLQCFEQRLNSLSLMDVEQVRMYLGNPQ